MEEALAARRNSALAIAQRHGIHNLEDSQVELVHEYLLCAVAPSVGILFLAAEPEARLKRLWQQRSEHWLNQNWSKVEK